MVSPANSPHINSDDDDRSPSSKWPNYATGTPPPAQTPATATTLHSSSLLNASTKRKSAFLPYRPQTTVLTNLQRGNTEATFCPVEISLSFHERTGQGEITQEQVKTEAEKHSDKGGIDFKDSLGFTPLHWAASYGQLAAAQMLVEAGANVNEEAPEMITPLLLAAAGGHNDIARFLLERGANAAHMDIVGNNALMYAAAGNHPHTCNEILAKNLDLTASNEDGDTAYTLAIDNGATLAQAVLEQYLCALLSLTS